jgi:cytochrome c peroxidase
MKLKSFSLFFVLLTLLTVVLSPVVLAQDNARFRAMFTPLPDKVDNIANPITPDKVVLGEKLYNDKRFSINKELSCNSCHDLKNYGVDNQVTSLGHNAKRGSRNSPSVFNAALHTTQFWDGREPTVEKQALGPVMNPVEMGMPSADEVVKRMKDDKEYQQLFAKAFPDQKDPITFENFGNAIGAFERTLITPSRFDEFLKGDDKALSAQELKGLQTFAEVGCVACHNGAALGGQMFQKLGLVKPYETKDLGRFEATKNEADKQFFKVPSLRNIEKTGPYFHDGSKASLEEVISIMGEYQLGRKLTPEQVAEIKSFLVSLTGKLASADNSKEGRARLK